MSVKVIWKTKKPGDRLGYIRLSSRIAGKTVLKNLPLEPVEKKHFNPNTQRLRASFTDHERYNNEIESKLDQAKKKGNKIKFLNDDKKSFVDFMTKVIDDNVTGNIGTKEKYQNLKNLIIDYNEYKFNVSDVKFSEITQEYLEGLRKYMSQVRKNKNNSIFYKFKTLKSFTTKADRQKIYSYDVNPFDLITNSLIDSDIDVLNKDDLKKLISTPLVEVYRSGQKFGIPLPDLSVLNTPKYANHLPIDDVRNFFLFQLFSQGIRVSDLITLRWQDFYITDEQIRIKKRMVKVKSFIDLMVNFNTMEYLYKFVPVDKLPEHLHYPYSAIMYSKIGATRLGLNYKGNFNIEIDDVPFSVEIDSDIITEFMLDFKSIVVSDGTLIIPRTNKSSAQRIEKNHIEYYVSVNEIIKLIDKRKNELSNKVKIKDIVKHKQELDSLISIDKKIIYLENLIDILREKINDGINKRKELSVETKTKDYKLFKDIVEYLSSHKETKKSFVFPLLDDKDFTDIDDDFYSMSETQYYKFAGRRAYYNRLLKSVGAQCKINKPLTSHLARHSFTSLMIEIGVNLNLADLMLSLGHKHLSTTQLYISKFTGKRVDNVNKEIVDFLDNI
jgi:integrase